MEVRRERIRRKETVSKAALLCFFSVLFFSFFSVGALFSEIGSGAACLGIESSTTGSSHPQTKWSRRMLIGPGSYPPRCTGKCGKCTPCRAVHVTVPPGTPVTTEYYPEAWRCKCGNRLYIP